MPANPLDWIGSELAERERADLLRQRRTAPSEGLVNFGSNDYLGLACDPRLAEAAAEASRQGWGRGSSPAVCGRTPAHEMLEQRLAEFEKTEAAIVFPSGFAANAGVIPALVDEGDEIFADAKNHASLIDGCRLSRARRSIYAHANADELESQLKQSSARRRLIVTDTLFSMDGDFAPLPSLAELAIRYEAMLVLDEAHATGVWGPNGRGSFETLEVDHPDLAHGVSLRIGTLSKALGASGGFVVGSRDAINWLHNRARPYVFSTAAPAACAAAAAAAIGIAQLETERRQRVIELSDSLRERLQSAGFNLGTSQSQIVPVLLGDPALAVGASEKLAQQGIYAPAIRPPSVPAGESLLRLSVTASHTPEHVDRLVAALQSV